MPATLDGVLALRGEDGTERAFEISANPAAVAAGRHRPRLVAGAAARLSRRHRAQRDALCLPDPVAEAAGPRQAGAWPPLGAAGPRARLYGRRARQALPRSGAALLALRAGGQAIGWGFQLQSPIFVAVIAYLLFAMGLSLSGVVAFGDGLRRYRRTAGRPVGVDGHVLHRRTGDDRRDPVHRSVYGRRARLCADRSRGGRDRDLSGARPRPRRSLPRCDPHPRLAARAAEAGSLDGSGQTAPRLPALWHGRLAHLGADPGSRAGRVAGRAVRARAGRLRRLDLWADAARRPARPPARHRARRRRNGRGNLSGRDLDRSRRRGTANAHRETGSLTSLSPRSGFRRSRPRASPSLSI